MASGGVIGQIDSYLKKKGSPLAGLGSVFVAAGKKYGVDPRLVVSISGIESSFGKFTYGDHNAWGWGPGIPFGSWEEGISTVTRGLRRGYLDTGRVTPAQIVGKYAPASDGNDEENWSKVVSGFMRELGASPAASAGRTVVSATPTSIAKTPAAGLDFSEATSLLEQLEPPTGLRDAALRNLTRIASTGQASPLSTLSGLSAGMQEDIQAKRYQAALKEALDNLKAIPTPQTAEKVGPTKTTKGTKPVTTIAGGMLPGLAEAFYDPLGSWDNGRFGGPIGNHDDHVHVSETDPQAMLRAIRMAQGMGLTVRENPYVDPVDDVHVEGSFHYQTFPGLFGGKRLGKGIDVYGPPDAMAAYYKAVTGS